MPTRGWFAPRRPRTFSLTSAARLSTATALAVVVSAMALWSVGSAPTTTTAVADGSDARSVTGGAPMLPLLSATNPDAGPRAELMQYIVNNW